MVMIHHAIIFYRKHNVKSMTHNQKHNANIMQDDKMRTCFSLFSFFFLQIKWSYVQFIYLFYANFINNPSNDYIAHLT